MLKQLACSKGITHMYRMTTEVELGRTEEFHIGFEFPNSYRIYNKVNDI